MFQRIQNSNYWIKPKLIVSFLLIVIFSVTAIVMTYQAVSDLKTTRQSFGLPGQKITVLNRLLASIYTEDSDFRMYVLTSNDDYLKTYNNNHQKVTAAIKSLQKLAYSNQSQLNSIKKIEKLLQNKREIEGEILQMRQSINTSIFYDRAMQRIARAGSETQRYHEIYKQKTVTQVMRDTVIYKKVSNESMAARIKRFFLGPERIDTIATDTLVEFTYDTIPHITYISDSIIQRLLLILDNIRDDQQNQLRLIDEKEKELLNRNRAILNQVQLIVTSIEKQEQAEAVSQALSVHEVLAKNLLVIFLLGTITFIVLVILIAIIMRDISRNTTYNAQLIEAKQYAENLLRLKEQFLANMSHEIRSPLSAIVGVSRQLSKTELNGKQKEYVDVLNSSSNHLMAVINDILDYSKLATGKLRLESKEFSPREVVNDTVKLFEVRAGEKGLQLLSSIDQSIPQSVIGDDFRLRQVLINLLSNAIKFTNQGSIIVSAAVLRKTDESVKIQFTVADTGIGISPEMQSQVFEEFTQADGGISRKFGGTGLGLTIVKKLVELQGGEISLTSEPNEGTIIRVVIPYSTRVTQAVDSEQENHYAIKAGTTILIIDDDEVNRLIIPEIAKNIGLQVDAIGEARQVLEQLNTKRYDAVITDIQMPEVSGYEVVQLIENAGYSIPVFAITANDMVDNPEHFSNLGFSGYLIKPFTENDLLRLLSPVIGVKTKELTLKKGKTDGSDKFDIDELYRFTGGNKKAVKLILESLLENTRKNIEELNQHVKSRNLVKASAVAHKMKSAFNQFRVYDIAGILQRIETLPPDKHKAATLYTERLNRRVRSFIVELQGQIDNLLS
ncbi:MAG TPA: response regulator [Bacteroidales bacterium]|nr:response regulator [Bacteroidales bacterium]